MTALEGMVIVTPFIYIQRLRPDGTLYTGTVSFQMQGLSVSRLRIFKTTATGGFVNLETLGARATVVYEQVAVATPPPHQRGCVPCGSPKENLPISGV